MATPLRVLIACEFTGTVRREFDRLGLAGRPDPYGLRDMALKQWGICT